MKTIDKPIVSTSVVAKNTPDDSVKPGVTEAPLHKPMVRPIGLPGTTYKLKTPLSTAAVYITINDMLIDAGTPQERIQPFEVFLNSKEMGNFQWIVAITRLISAIFRNGGDVTFIVEELKSVFDPKGGYLAKGGRYVPSLVAEIGSVIEEHFIKIGLLNKTLPAEVQELIDKKTEELTAKGISLDSAGTCPQCGEKSLIVQEGCNTCLSCGYSKCGG